jgi:hypothetical protein
LFEQAGLEAMVEQSGAAFVIVGHDSPDRPEAFHELLLRQPPVRALAITGEGRAAILYELRPQRIPIVDLSASRLVGVIRGRATLPPLTETRMRELTNRARQPGMGRCQELGLSRSGSAPG